MTYDYDLLVIGAGPGGLAAAKQAVQYGVKVAIVEQEQIGGLCVNRGCVPKKLMVYAAAFDRLIKDARDYGWQIESGQFDWQQFVQDRDRTVAQIRESQTDTLLKTGISLLRGQATFLDPHQLSVGDRQITSNRVLIAVGGKPVKPDIPGVEYTLTSDEMFNLPELPARIAIIGGSYIGVEFASMLCGFGVKVTLMNREDCVLTGFDLDLANTVHKGLIQRGIDSFCNTTAKEIKKTSEGLQIDLVGDRSSQLTVDKILCATGRTPNLEPLDLDRAGVALEGKAIAVDEYSRTSQDHIYAVGDCTNRLPLTPVARVEGRAFANTVFGQHPQKVDYGHVPSAVFSDPEVAAVGMTEAQACEQYGQEAIVCECTEFHPLYNRLSQSAPVTLIKQVIHQESGRILGVHLVVEQAAEIVQGIALAMKQGLLKSDLNEMIGIHPTSTEELFG
jgi:glutathione reductase (NADPH)